jgi:murein DD-endopeptidase MepM/ murein hydrolase activator NlpD
LVINYSEVDANSLKDYNLKVGSSVVAGQPIGTIRKMDTSAMLHFENYRSGTTANCNLYPDGPDAAKQAKSKQARARLYNPTQYLLALAKSGR